MDVRKKFFLFLLVLGLAAVMVCACAIPVAYAAPNDDDAQAEDEAADAGDPLVLVYFTPTYANSYSMTIQDGIQQWAFSDGNEVDAYTYVNDYGSLATQIKDVVDGGADFLFVETMIQDGDVSDKDLAKALQAAGDVPVIVLGGHNSNSSRVLTTVLDDYAGQGAACADMMMEDHANGGKVAMAGYYNDPAAQERMKGFEDALTDDFEVVADAKRADMTVQEALEAADELDAIFVANEELAVAAGDVPDDVFLYVTGATPDIQQLLVDGKFAGISPSQPHGLGVEAYFQMTEYLDGKELEEEVLLEALSIRAPSAQKNMFSWY